MNEPELEHDGELVPVYATGDLMDAEMVANLLNEEGVQAMVKAKAIQVNKAFTATPPPPGVISPNKKASSQIRSLFSDDHSAAQLQPN